MAQALKTIKPEPNQLENGRFGSDLTNLVMLISALWTT